MVASWTRTQWKEVLDYVLNTFCHDDDDDNILSKSLAHEGIKDIEDLYLYKDADFDQFQYVSDSTTKQQDTIWRGQAGKLRMIKGFVAYKILPWQRFDYERPMDGCD